MKYYFSLILLITLSLQSNLCANETNFFDFKTKTISGEAVDLKDYKGKVILVVNTASRCGFTPQYKALQELYSTYADQGFMVLAFPSSDFLNQELNNPADIKKFCLMKYGIKFPLFEKTKITGSNKSPIFKFLTENQSDLEGEIQWNFEKFLIDRNGKLRARFGSFTGPLSSKVVKAIKDLLNESV